MKIPRKQRSGLYVWPSHLTHDKKEGSQSSSRLYFWFYIGLFLIIISSQSCSSPPHLTLFSTDSEWVDLREWPVGYISIGAHSHPFSLSSSELNGILGSVYFRESMLFSFLLGKPKRVFSEHQVNVLSSYVSKALDQALPQEVVAFKIREDDDSLRYAKGFCFIVDGDFHLVIDELNKHEFQNKETGPRPNTLRSELVPGPGQRLFARRSEGKGLEPHWIVISLQQKGIKK